MSIDVVKSVCFGMDTGNAESESVVAVYKGSSLCALDQLSIDNLIDLRDYLQMKIELRVYAHNVLKKLDD